MEIEIRGGSSLRKKTLVGAIRNILERHDFKDIVVEGDINQAAWDGFCREEKVIIRILKEEQGCDRTPSDVTN